VSLFNKTDEIIDRLELLDIYCIQNNVQAELIILGASGLLIYMEMKNKSFRPTRDIDVNLLSASNPDKIRELLELVKIDTVGGVMELPPMEDFSGKEIFKIEGAEFANITVYVPSIELLACTKIFSTRKKDLVDLQETDILVMCEIGKLMRLVDEYKSYMMNEKNPDANIHQLKQILIDKEIDLGGESK